MVVVAAGDPTLYAHNIIRDEQICYYVKEEKHDNINKQLKP